MISTHRKVEIVRLDDVEEVGYVAIPQIRQVREHGLGIFDEEENCCGLHQQWGVEHSGTISHGGQC